MKWFRATGAYLVGQLLIFALIKLVFHVTWGDLVGPYLAFIGSIPVTVLIAGFLNSSHCRKLTPRQFALGAGLSAAYLALSADIAFAYLGLVLGLLTLQFVSDWTNWVFIVLPLTLFFSISVYRIAHRNAKVRIAKQNSEFGSS